MADVQSHREELGTMRDELSRNGGVDGQATSKPAEAVAATGCVELESLLKEFQARLGDVSEGAEELVKSHPVAALASAFLAGLAVGRLTGRR
jgi:hypothetical protein